jgi:hypothetical protein
MRRGAKGGNIAVYTATIRIQDIVDIQNRLQDIGSTQDVVPIYLRIYKMKGRGVKGRGKIQDTVVDIDIYYKIEWYNKRSTRYRIDICLYTQDIGLNSEGGRGERVGRRTKPQDIVRYKT